MDINRYRVSQTIKSSGSCPICGSKVPSGELFCEKCGMRIHGHSWVKGVAKANLRSTYFFYDESDYENAKYAICSVNQIVYEKIIWYGEWTFFSSDERWDCRFGHDVVWRVDLNDDLSQEELEWAVGRIREHTGIYYQR